ncbi:MAG: FAD-binding oxidoreductase [Leptolyngbyaceae cyanobacterium]
MDGGSGQQTEILQALERVVGASGVSSGETLEFLQPEVLQAAIAPGESIAAIVSPATPEELADVVTTTHHHGWRLIPCGSGSKLHWGGLVGKGSGIGDQGSGIRDQGLGLEIQNPKSKIQNPSPLLLLTTYRLNRLIEHAVGDLTVTVEAGMKFSDLQGILAKAGQFLAIDPAYPDQATIGGIVATADTGSLRQRYQSVRDMLLGISFVRADGELAKAGGRVVKNVAGYDLMKLLTGSYGTLGIITQVTFRVYPLPEASQTIVLSGSEDRIAQATKTLLSSALTPASADLFSATVVQDLGWGTGTGLAVRFQSIELSVKEQINRVKEVGQVLGLSHVTFAEAEDRLLWERLRERMTIAPQNSAITCKIGIRPSAAIGLFQHLDQLFQSSSFCQIHAGSGLGRLLLKDATIQPTTLMKIRTYCQTNGGFLTILQAPTAFKQAIEVWGYAGNALQVMQKIKHQFDPQHLLNPGRFVNGI